MSDFYALLGPYYDDFFPLDPAQASWAEGLLRKTGVRGKNGPRVLDAGCGTGSLALALAGLGMDVEAIDLDEGLLATARGKRELLRRDIRERVVFKKADIRDVPGIFEEGSFDGLFCLGNTLPHLGGLAEIGSVLAGFRRVLKAGGVLGLQIIDFERIFRLGLQGLPALRAGDAKLERSYVGLELDAPFSFRARLSAPGGSGRSTVSAEAETRLFALKADALDALLADAGFAERSYAGGFAGEEADGTRLPLVVTARGLPKENAPSVG